MHAMHYQNQFLRVEVKNNLFNIIYFTYITDT